MNPKTFINQGTIIIAVVFGLSVSEIPSGICNDAGWYMGASVGQSKDQDMYSTTSGARKIISELADAGVTAANATVTQIEDSDTGWKIFAGYQFCRYFAAEASYVDLGTVDGDAFGNLVYTGLYSGPYTATLEGEVDGVGLAGIGMLPIGERFGLFGKVGAFWSNVDVSFKIRTPILTVSGTVEENDTEFTFGFGAQCKIWKGFTIRAEWERFIDTFTSDQHDFDLFSIGIQYHFK